MSKEVFERAKKEINLVEYITTTCSVTVTGRNGAWNINPNPFDMQSNDNFKVSYKDGVWLYNAFNSEEGGTIIDFIQRREGLYDEQLMNKLNKLLHNGEFSEMPVLIEEDEHKQEDINKLVKYIDVNDVSYFERRGLSKEVINKYKLGTCDSGLIKIYSELGMKTHPNMRNHKYMIPCYDEDNNLKFIVARNNQEPLQEGSKKTWNIKGLKTYFLNQYYLEGINISEGDIIVITESWGDALSVESINNKVKVVALHSVNNIKRVGELLTNNIDRFDKVKFIIAFNNDKAKDDRKSPGKIATKKAIKIMEQLNLEYKVFMPNIYNDLNEWLLSDKNEFENSLNEALYKLNCIDKINLKGSLIEAFFSWIDDDLMYIVNCNDERRYLYWNKKSWVRKTEEELRSLYGKFLNECELQIENNRKNGKYSSEEYSRILSKVKKWRSTTKAKECLSLIAYDENLTINMDNYKKQHHIYVSANGMIINLREGYIRKADKSDLILHTSKYNLIDKDEAVEFMESKVLRVYRNYSLGEERLEYILNFIAMKLCGRSFQSAIINIGPSKSGKSMMKNLITGLFDGDVSHIPYTYLTTAHKGNMGAERDDIIVGLNNKKFCLASEAEKNNAPIAIGRFKNILSNSITDARATGGKMQNGIDLTHLDMVIDTNEMPSFNGYDDAIDNRLIFINWQNSIPVEERIDNFNGEVIQPNIDKIWSYFIYRAIDLKDKKLIAPEIVRKDSAERKAELDDFTFNVVNKLQYDKDGFIELNALIERLNLFNLCPELKSSKSLHKNVIDKIKTIPGFEEVIQHRRGRLKINGIKGVRFK
ncbi:toprim domain-containing protein [Clostridium butyricum]